MTEINKHAFVSELAKFLSFMRDEDREAVLDMYSALFDEVVDTRKLLALLMSPTRQAVIIARAYDATAPAAGGEMPKFLKVVENIRNTAISEGLMDTEEEVVEAASASELPMEETEEEDNSIPVLENQVSMFDEAETAKEESAAQAFVFETESEETVSEKTDEPEADNSAEDGEPAPAQDSEAEEASPEEEKPVGVIKSEGEIDAFIADFEREAEAVINGGVAQKSIEEEAEAVMAAATEEITAEHKSAEVKTVTKARVFLLILYCLFAIPITLVVLSVLLVPAVALFGCAVAVSVAGAYAMSAVFSGFAVLADILVVLGCALIVIAIALFFIWAFIWFVACVMVGFVRAVVNLGRKWCFKEVPVA